MSPLPIIALLAWWGVYSTTATSPPCPQHCHCDKGRGIIECDYGTLIDFRETRLPDYLYDLKLASKVEPFLPENAFSNLRWLREVDLRQNEIEGLPNNTFQSNTRLRVLDLHYNHISELPNGVFDNLRKLYWLNLSNNRIRVLPNGVFDDLEDLGYLFLNNNKMEWITDGVFDNLGSLKYLSLNNNKLEVIPDGVFDNLGSLQLLHLQMNPLRVGYTLCNLVSVLRSQIVVKIEDRFRQYLNAKTDCQTDGLPVCVSASGQSDSPTCAKPCDGKRKFNLISQNRQFCVDSIRRVMSNIYVFAYPSGTECRHRGKYLTRNDYEQTRNQLLRSFINQFPNSEFKYRIGDGDSADLFHYTPQWSLKKYSITICWETCSIPTTGNLLQHVDDAGYYECIVGYLPKLPYAKATCINGHWQGDCAMCGVPSGKVLTYENSLRYDCVAPYSHIGLLSNGGLYCSNGQIQNDHCSVQRPCDASGAYGQKYYIQHGLNSQACVYMTRRFKKDLFLFAYPENPGLSPYPNFCLRNRFYLHHVDYYGPRRANGVRTFIDQFPQSNFVYRQNNEEKDNKNPLIYLYRSKPYNTIICYEICQVSAMSGIKEVFDDGTYQCVSGSFPQTPFPRAECLNGVWRGHCSPCGFDDAATGVLSVDINGYYNCKRGKIPVPYARAVCENGILRGDCKSRTSRTDVNIATIWSSGSYECNSGYRQSDFSCNATTHNGEFDAMCVKRGTEKYNDWFKTAPSECDAINKQNFP